MLEKQIEKAVCDYAKEHGILVYKFTSPSRSAVPDRMFILPSGKIFFIEFKRDGGKLTPQQERECQRIADYNIPVYVIDNIEKGKIVILFMLNK